MTVASSHQPVHPILTAAEEERDLELLRQAHGFVPGQRPPPPANDARQPGPGLAKARPRPRVVRRE